MKLIAPAGVTSTTHEGVEIHVDGDGTVDVPPHVATALYAHGFHPPNQPPENFKDMPREMILARLNLLATPDLVKLMEASGKDDSEDDRSSGKSSVDVDPNASVADIQGMKRDQLFAYLKLKGVSAAPPITVDRLREIAVETANKANN